MEMSADFPTVASPTTTTLHRSMRIVRCVVSIDLSALCNGSGAATAAPRLLVDMVGCVA